MDRSGSGSAETARLSDFQRRRLDLADTLRAVLPVTRGCGDERRERDVRALLTRLAAGRFQLAVAGQFSRGKTTLMNALLGGEYLPTGALPTTSVITTVRYGTRARALVRSHASALPVEVAVAELGRFVAQSSSERVRMRVSSVDVELPAELLRLGFEFVDTPGVGSAIAANTALTLRYLPQADAVVFVTGFDSALTEAEADFLVRAAGQAGKLFLVVNKRDLVAEPQAAEVTGYVRRWARQNLRAAEPLVFGLSALDALNSAVTEDGGRNRSGIEPFRAALIEFLTTEQGKTSLAAVAAAAGRIVSRQQRDMRAGQVTSDNHDAAAVTADFDAGMTNLQARINAVAERITGTVTAAAAEVVAERSPAWRAGLRDLIEPLATSPRDPVSSPGVQVEAALAELRGAGRQPVAEWLEERAAEMRAAILDATGGEIGSLLELADLPREHGAELLGLPAFPVGPAGWSAEDLPDLLIPSVQWIVPDQQERRQRRRTASGGDAAQQLADRLAAAVDSFVARAGAALVDAAADWAARLREQAARHARAEADQFRRYLLNPPRGQDVVVLSDVSKRLTACSASLTRWQPGIGSVPEQTVSVASARGHGRACEICGPLETALNDYLIGRQFTLATSESDQVGHAVTGGFCALHTWQYARLASPVGISAGNARLAGAVGDALATLSARAPGTRELAQEAAGLATASACPGCALLADAEQRLAEECARDAAPSDPPALCVRHLALVLQAGPSREAGKAMVGELAQALQRAAADMRSYALKREALRRGLITDDEDAAYRHALALLAGRPALAQSWETE
jgi:predicted GTPase